MAFVDLLGRACRADVDVVDGGQADGALVASRVQASRIDVVTGHHAHIPAGGDAAADLAAEGLLAVVVGVPGQRLGGLLSYRVQVDVVAGGQRGAAADAAVGDLRGLGVDVPHGGGGEYAAGGGDVFALILTPRWLQSKIPV